MTLLILTALPAVGALNNSYEVKNPVEPRDVVWYKTYGGSDYDLSGTVLQTNDGGYILCGETASYGAQGWDALVVKTDADGNEEWHKIYGGVAEFDFLVFVQQTNDGGYIFTGATYSFGAGLQDAWVLKTDADGNEEWNKTYGGTNYDWGWRGWPTTDGGYIIAGGTVSFGTDNLDFWLIKTDADGNEEWNKTYGGSSFEYLTGMIIVDDGYILVGYAVPGTIFGKAFTWLVKTDFDGNKLWGKAICGSRRHNAATDIKQTGDGGYIICGESVDFGFFLSEFFFYMGGDMWLVKTDADGNMEWENQFGGKYLEDGSRGVELTDDGGYLIAGFNKGFGSVIKQAQMGPIFSKIWLVKTNADGNKTWEREYSRGMCWWIDKTTDGGYIVSGGTKPHGLGDAFLLKIDTNFYNINGV